MTEVFDLARLDPDHDLSAFGCGHEELDRWLRDNALRAQRQSSARVWVLTEPGKPRVLGYVAIAPTVVERDDLPGRLAGGLSRVPAYLIGKLAVDRSIHGRGMGRQLLRKALENILAAAAASGGRVVVVDAIDATASAFYVRHGFVPVAGSHRLALLIQDVQASGG